MELTLQDIKELLGTPVAGEALTSGGDLIHELVGSNVFVRTVTMHHVGYLSAFDGANLKLEDASWVADSGRFGEALKTGKLAETERFPNPVIVNWGAGVDVTVWAHPLP